MNHKKIVCLLAALLLCLGGCGGQPDRSADAGKQTSGSGTQSTAASSGDSGKETSEQKFVPYQAPEFLEVVFHEDKAEEKNNVQVDLSSVNQGYLAICAQSDKKIVCSVIKDDMRYNFYPKIDGTPSFFPLTSGDGTYTIKVGVNTESTTYSFFYNTECEVRLDDEFQPFLRPSAYVDYGKDSDCVKKAAELASGAEDALGVVAAVYDYICDNVTYDYAKAADIQSQPNYLPNPDSTLSEGKGICFDYAALVAAMLRSQGIPTKLIMGYVSPEDTYHAWNMFYTEKTGWVTVEYKVSGGSWNRLDLTFSANGEDDEFIGDGSNYADTGVY